MGDNKFKEEDLKKDHHFKLHIEYGHAAALHHANPVHHMTQESRTIEKNTIESGHDSPKEKRDIKTILKNAGRQILASFIILIIGFLALNWSAYYKIAKNEWQKFFGTQTESPLAQIATNKPVIYTQKTLETSSDPAIQKKQIPELNLEIAPYDNRLIIPRIDQNIPVVNVSSESLLKRDWDALEKDMQEALKDGVVHYPGTSLPGQTGNVVITGHSSYFPWDPGRFKDVFALLHDVVEGDKIVIYYNQDKYLYEVDNIKIILPEEIDVLKQTPDDRITLITCTPVGTNLKRLIVSGKLIAKNGQAIKTP